MTTWYQTSPNSLVLYEVKVTRETPSSVWVHKYGLSRKEKRHSQFADYWPTLEEALLVLKKQAQRQYDRASDELKEASEMLEAIQKREANKTQEP